MNNQTSMDSLSSKNYIRQLLAEYGLYPKKHLGQNFLTDAFVLSKIVAAAELTSDDLVIEVGPGLGVLTKELAARAGRVVAVEIDEQLADILRGTMPPNVEVVRQDILKVDIFKLISNINHAHPIKIVANLPYYITSPVIFGLLEQGMARSESEHPIHSMVVMVQKEVAERFLASVGTKAYGIPTLSLAYYGNAELVANVPPHCFFPRPDVHSAVIKINITPPRKDLNPNIFFPLVKAAFANRRKTLQNCLAISGISKAEAAELIAKANLAPNIRGEALAFADFVNITNIIQQNKVLLTP